MDLQKDDSEAKTRFSSSIYSSFPTSLNPKFNGEIRLKVAGQTSGGSSHGEPLKQYSRL